LVHVGADIDLTSESPIGHGRVICFSIYCGAQFNFGAGPRVFVDLLLGEEGIMDVFRPYFEDARIKKVWHNYSFDRAVLGNHGVNVRGFGGDTMHMARLWSAARTGGYSLQALTRDLLPVGKVPMSQRFGKPRVLKNGTLGKVIDVPSTVELHTNVRFEAIMFVTFFLLAVSKRNPVNIRVTFCISLLLTARDTVRVDRV